MLFCSWLEFVLIRKFKCIDWSSRVLLHLTYIQYWAKSLSKTNDKKKIQTIHRKFKCIDWSSRVITLILMSFCQISYFWLQYSNNLHQLIKMNTNKAIFLTFWDMFQADKVRKLICILFVAENGSWWRWTAWLQRVHVFDIPTKRPENGRRCYATQKKIVKAQDKTSYSKAQKIKQKQRLKLKLTQCSCSSRLLLLANVSKIK